MPTTTQERRTALEPARFQYGDALLLAGLRERYTMGDTERIPEQWKRFVPRLGHVPGQIGRVAYGACLRISERPDDGFDYLSGVAVRDFDSLTGDLARLTLPPYHYAVFPHRTHISELKSTIDGIFNGWLPASGFALIPGGEGRLVMLERYGEGFDPAGGQGDVEVWVPIEKKR